MYFAACSLRIDRGRAEGAMLEMLEQQECPDGDEKDRRE